MAKSRFWQSRSMKAILEMLAEQPNGSLRWEQIEAPLRERWENTFEPDDVERSANGLEHWWNYASWGASTLVTAGALEKRRGVWTITPLGRRLIAEYPEADKLIDRARALETANRAQRQRGHIRAAGGDFTDDLDSPEALEDGTVELDDETRPGNEQLKHLDSSVARKLLVSPEWLDDFVELLNESRQVVLYGPPGTGKTYLARKIAEQLVGAERVRLVQFHPSYTYEDFFEGYRPSSDNRSGTVSLELKPGPLRALATEARDHPEHAFVMIIDELNRANIAKVFGELYFLLEYRDDAVEVMYGGDPFTLPRNLYFICTMNTADRSIALLDAAMRRRFAFLELHPSEEPTKSMLLNWLAQRGHPAAAADLLARLNGLVTDRDAHIGPSYFMHDDQSEARLRRVFRTQIEPLLRETLYDHWSTVGSQFGFDRLWKEVNAAAAPDFDSGSESESGDGELVEVDATSLDPTRLPPPSAGAGHSPAAPGPA